MAQHNDKVRVLVELSEIDMQADPVTMRLSDLYTIDDLAAAHPKVLSKATLQWQLRHRATNGLAGACVLVGKKLLISKSHYERWLASQAV